MPVSTYESLTALKNFLYEALRDGLYVYQSHSMRTPTVAGDPSPIGFLMPPLANPIPPGPPTPKTGALGAVAEQGGGSYDVPPPESVPLRSSLLFSPQENGPQQRSDVPADQEVTGNVGFVLVTGQSGEDQGVSALMERDAVIAELRRQVRVLHAQNNVQTNVQNDAQNNVQNNFSSQTRPGVIPNRGQTGLQSKAPPRGRRMEFQERQGRSTLEFLSHHL